MIATRIKRGRIDDLFNWFFVNVIGTWVGLGVKMSRRVSSPYDFFLCLRRTYLYTGIGIRPGYAEKRLEKINKLVRRYMMMKNLNELHKEMDEAIFIIEDRSDELQTK